MDRAPRFMARTKSFQRRSRDLSPALAAAFEAGKANHLLEVPRDEGMTSVDPSLVLDPHTLFPQDAPLVIEVGSGRGEQILHTASCHPEKNFLAFEVWVPGVARLVAAAAKEGLTNLKVVEADAQQALKTLLPAQSVAELWTFFPDPWRKSKHRKRRLVAADFAQTAARILEDQAVWRMATDWADYAVQMLQVIEASPDFDNPCADQILNEVLDAATAADLAEGALVPEQGGFAPRFAGRVQTHFEERGHDAGRVAYDLMAIRVPRPTRELSDPRHRGDRNGGARTGAGPGSPEDSGGVGGSETGTQ